MISTIAETNMDKTATSKRTTLLISATIGILMLVIVTRSTQACHLPTNAGLFNNGLRPNALGPQYPQYQNGMMGYGMQPNVPYNPYGQYGWSSVICAVQVLCLDEVRVTTLSQVCGRIEQNMMQHIIYGTIVRSGSRQFYWVIEYMAADACKSLR